MKLRLVACLVLLLVAVGLPLAAVSTSGPPWGYRGHQAVVLEVVGTVEGAASESRRKKAGTDDDRLVVVPNLHLDSGDTLRVARLSQARVRFDNAVVTVGDGATLVIGNQRLRLTRGLLGVDTVSGAKPFEVELESGGVIAVHSGGGPAHASLIADGKGGVRAIVDGGSIVVRIAERDTLLEAGRLLLIDAGVAEIVERPTSLSLSATCSGTRLNIVAPGQVQVFVGGAAVAYPDVSAGAATGSAVLDVDPGTGDVGVFARDVAGNASQITVSCEKKK